MKKRIITIMAFAAVVISMYGCCESNTETKILDDGRSITEWDIVKHEQLVYDSTTKIVYIKQYTYSGNYIYTLYLSENGLPYKYVDGKLVEIGQSDMHE